MRYVFTRGQLWLLVFVAIVIGANAVLVVMFASQGRWGSSVLQFVVAVSMVVFLRALARLGRASATAESSTPNP
jgi:hypothetical protein